MLKHSLMLFPAILCHLLLQTSIAGECASNLGESHETTSNNTPVVYFWAVSIQAACQHWVDMKNQGEDNCEAVSVVSAPPAGKCLPSYPPSFTTTRLHRANPDSIRTATNRKIPSTPHVPPKWPSFPCRQLNEQPPSRLFHQAYWHSWHVSLLVYISLAVS